MKRGGVLFLLFSYLLLILLVVTEVIGGIKVEPLYSVDVKIKDLSNLKSGGFANLKADIRNKGAALSDNCDLYFVLKKVVVGKNSNGYAYSFGPYSCDNLLSGQEISAEFDWKIPSTVKGVYQYRARLKNKGKIIGQSKWDTFTIKKTLQGKLKLSNLDLHFFYFPEKKELEVEVYLSGNFLSKEHVKLS